MKLSTMQCRIRNELPSIIILGQVERDNEAYASFHMTPRHTRHLTHMRSPPGPDCGSSRNFQFCYTQFSSIRKLKKIILSSLERMKSIANVRFILDWLIITSLACHRFGRPLCPQISIVDCVVWLKFPVDDLFDKFNAFGQFYPEW